MKVNLLKASRTVIIPQSRSKSKGTNRRVLHNDFVFFADIPIDTEQNVLDELIEALERKLGDEIWDVAVVFDYTAVAPDGSEGVTTVKLSTGAMLRDKISVEI
ncbi:MAG: hypothetical protein IJ071_12750 [Ruminococcus sp.]|nr:hypothetical protein [Ruminococcus sp.]